MKTAPSPRSGPNRDVQELLGESVTDAIAAGITPAWWGADPFGGASTVDRYNQLIKLMRAHCRRMALLGRW